MRHILALVSFYLTFEIILAFLPPNWRDQIDPEMMGKYQTQSLNSYSPNNFQGDITGISKDDFEEGEKLGLIDAINDQSKLWPNGIVPIQFSKVFTENEDRWFELQTIHFAMQQITSSTSGCIRFINRTTEVDYIHILRGHRCSSDVGRQGGRQLISLDVGGCLHKIGSIQHELLHALGFYHEMSRKDRDEYIWINWDNIQEPYRNDFRIVTDGLDFGIKYDYESVLNYGPNAFAINPLIPTIIPKHDYPHIGQNDGLSILDVIRLKKAYNCLDANDITFSQSKSLPNSHPDNENTTEITVILTSASTTWSIEGLGKIPIRTTRSNPADLTLPDLKPGSLSDMECKALTTEHCFISSWANCSTGLFGFHCTSGSTDFEIRAHLEKIKQTIPSSPIQLGIENKTELKPETFQSVSENIAFFQVAWTNGFNCDTLRNLPLPNLLQLIFYKSTNITVNRDSLRPFQKMRLLFFDESTILSLEKGFLENLISLKTIGFDNAIALPWSLGQWSHLWRLHCSEEYSWLREYLNQHPQLIQPRKQGEIYSLPGAKSLELTRQNLFYPVDCGRDDLTGDQNQTVFSLND